MGAVPDDEQASYIIRIYLICTIFYFYSSKVWYRIVSETRKETLFYRRHI